MTVSPYLGHANQCSGVEEVRLVGGKGDGMRLLQIRNGDPSQTTLTPWEMFSFAIPLKRRRAERKYLAEQDDVQGIQCRSFGVHREEKIQYREIDGAATDPQK